MCSRTTVHVKPNHTKLSILWPYTHNTIMLFSVIPKTSRPQHSKNACVSLKDWIRVGFYCGSGMSASCHKPPHGGPAVFTQLGFVPLCYHERPVPTAKKAANLTKTSCFE